LGQPRVALIGLPNAGKSTLANALLGRPVSITSDVPGTTRDWVDAAGIFVSNQGTQVPVMLVDTAGVRETSDVIEVEAIVRTRAQARAADVVIVVIDGSEEKQMTAVGLIREVEAMGMPVMVAVNKVDAGRAWRDRQVEETVRVVEVSALERTGLAKLMDRLLAEIGLDVVETREAFVFTERQRKLVEYLQRVGESYAACDALRELIGTEGM